MSAFNFVSIEAVIDKIIRATNLGDSSYLGNIIDWIAEAMAKMESYQSVHHVRRKAKIDHYQVHIPKEAIGLLGVSYNGRRLQEGSVYSGPTKSAYTPELYKTVVGSRPGYDSETAQDIETPEILYQSEKTFLVAYDANEWCTEHWYRKLKGNSIEVSIKEGHVYLYLTTNEVDCNGYLMIPDDEEFKEAIYWYVRMKLVESGWPDPIFGWKDLYELWEKHCLRGSNSVAAFTPEAARNIKRNVLQLTVPSNWAAKYKGM